MKKLAALIENAEQGELRLLLSAVEKKLGLGRGGAGESAWAASEDASCYLDAAQLARLTESFSAWKNSAPTPAQRRSRSRLWLAYLLLRYGALRLGEMTALDDRSDIDFERCLIEVQGPPARSVQLPADVMREIAAFLDDPMFYSLRGEVFCIDPGYLRRKFYEQAELAGLPRDLANPRALRRSRGMELVRGGVPFKAVQLFLGRRERVNSDLGYLPPTAGRRMVQQYLAREVKMKTSARNIFVGSVSRLARDGLLAEVELVTLSGLKVVAIITEESLENLCIDEGRIVTASVKAPWVVLAAPEGDGGLKTSARNQFCGKVTDIKEGRLASEVTVELYEGSKVCALLTGDSLKRLNIERGKDMTVMFRAFSVILNAD